MNNDIVGVILAAGKGSRINSQDANKVSYSFLGKPMVLWGVELFDGLVAKTIVVIGAFADSVRNVLTKNGSVVFVEQKEQLGTGHAVKVAMGEIEKSSPAMVLVGMGDHMMYYKRQAIQNLIDLHKTSHAVVSFITTTVPDPSGYGRILRDKDENIVGDIEEKDATEEQKKIDEINAGFYCFDFKFLKTHINALHISSVTKEYYLPDLIHTAFVEKMKVSALKVPFTEVGMGVNKHQELEDSQKYYEKINFPTK